MLGAHLTPREYLDRCAAEFDKLDFEVIGALGREIYDAYEDGRFVFICGNGGSGSNSSHKCELFDPLPPLPQINTKRPSSYAS